MTAAMDHGAIMLTPQERASIIKFITAMGGDASDFVTAEGTNLPKELNEIIRKVVDAINDERPISITTMPRELTTTTAASLLGVSRPTLMKYIRAGRIASHKVGTHHRLYARDVLELQEQLKEEQRQAVFEVMDRDSELER